MDLTLDYSLLIVVFTVVINIVCSEAIRLPLPPEMHQCLKKCLTEPLQKNRMGLEGTTRSNRDEHLYIGIMPFCPFYFPDHTDSICSGMRNFTTCARACSSEAIRKEGLGVLEQAAQDFCSMVPKIKAMSEKDHKCIAGKCYSAYDECNNTCIGAMENAIAKQTQESDKERRIGCDLWLCGYDCGITKMTASCGQGAKLPLGTQKRTLEVLCGDKNAGVKDPNGRGGGAGGTRSSDAWVIAMIMISFIMLEVLA